MVVKKLRPHRPTLFDIDKIDLNIKDQDYYDFMILLVEMKKHPVLPRFLL